MDNKVAEKQPGIYEYILQEEQNFRTERVPLAANWRDWNMYEHIDRSFTLKNSRFYKGPQDYKRPFNNIILPIANVNYRTEGFDLKDVQLYVDNAENYHKSFFARKMNTWWAKENKIDEAIDETVESYFDYGLALLRNVNEARPVVIQLQQIAFCDQTDIMSGPICLKHHYSISELKDMAGKWDSRAIDETILLAKFSKNQDKTADEETKTPGKYIEVYDLEGMAPESWLGPEKMGQDWEDTGKYTYARFMVTFNVSPQDGVTKIGKILFKGKAKPSYKALKRDPIFGRACGRGGIEELFHPQIWTNYSELQIQQMLEAASKVVYLTTDKKLKSQNLENIKNGRFLEKSDNTTVERLDNQPYNKNAFDNFVNKWEQVARTIGSASDPQLGLNPTSGTPLGTTEIVTAQGVGIHQYRQGKIAEFWAEIYRDWVLPYFKTEIAKGNKWLDDLTLDELQDIAEKISTKKTNERIKKLILDGKVVAPQEMEVIREVMKQEFMNGGPKRFLQILKGEFDDLPMDVEISIANKQKNLFEMVGKLNNVFRTLFTPGAIQAIQQNKGLAQLLNDILETSGLSPVNFGSVTAQQTQQPQQPQQMQPGAVPSPVQPETLPVT